MPTAIYFEKPLRWILRVSTGKTLRFCRHYLRRHKTEALFIDGNRLVLLSDLVLGVKIPTTTWKFKVILLLVNYYRINEEESAINQFVPAIHIYPTKNKNTLPERKGLSKLQIKWLILRDGKLEV